jgi:hypothetical protein
VLEHARVVLEDGGDLDPLAECGDGRGRADFLDWFVPGGARAMAERLVESYKINGQTAWVSAAGSRSATASTSCRPCRRIR